MEYKEKFRTASSLHSPEHLEKDLALLATVDPSSDFIGKPITEANRATRAEQVVWVLLDYVSAERVIANRLSENPIAAKASEGTTVLAPIKKKLQKKRSILISHGQVFISKMYKGRISYITIGFTRISKWLSSIRSWIATLRKRI